MRPDWLRSCLEALCQPAPLCIINSNVSGPPLQRYGQRLDRAGSEPDRRSSAAMSDQPAPSPLTAARLWRYYLLAASPVAAVAALLYGGVLQRHNAVRPYYR